MVLAYNFPEGSESFKRQCWGLKGDWEKTTGSYLADQWKLLLFKPVHIYCEAKHIPNIPLNILIFNLFCIN